jgi:hypothetical protein
MELSAQDAVLNVLILLTRFPPAVRALFTLMSGRSPSPGERAALAQSIYEVLKDVVPMTPIKSDEGRILEGARLLFGFILEKAKEFTLKDSTRLPYMSSLHVRQLRCLSTREPIWNPIPTRTGIVERGYYEAFKKGGILLWRSDEQPLSDLPLDSETRRMHSLGGGLVPYITLFRIDHFDRSPYEKDGQARRLLLSKNLSDLATLSACCSRNKLSVVRPSSLSSANIPALTLDRKGLLAVYTPGPEAGNDLKVLRPADGGEEYMDVSTIDAILIPILEQRRRDGTSVFDAFDNEYRVPDEIVVICVDCSGSMRKDIASSSSKTDDADDICISRNPDSTDLVAGDVWEQSNSEVESADNETPPHMSLDILQSMFDLFLAVDPVLIDLRIQDLPQSVPVNSFGLTFL